MATTQIDWHWFDAYGSGYHTIDVNLPPAWIGAQVALRGHSGGGLTVVGIKHYRKRLGSGQDQDIDFGGWSGWPAVIFDFVSSITFAIANGKDQGGYLVARMDYWA